MLKQIDLNVKRPEGGRLPELYAGDSINWITVRIYFDEADADAVMQLCKDKGILPALWSPRPVDAAL